jgi:hypothetical protein
VAGSIFLRTAFSPQLSPLREMLLSFESPGIATLREFDNPFFEGFILLTTRNGFGFPTA